MTDEEFYKLGNKSPIVIAVDALVKGARMVESGWCRRAMARSARGYGVSFHSRDATQWCAAGAIDKVLSPIGRPLPSFCKKAREIAVEHVIRVARKRHPELRLDSIGLWNDTVASGAGEVAETLRAAAHSVVRETSAASQS